MTVSLNVRNLRFGSENHTRVLQSLIARKEPAKDRVDERTADFERHDEMYDAFLPEKEADAARRLRYEGGEPDYYTVVLPYSYATLLSAHTYWTSVYLARTPVFQFTGRHGEPMQQVQAVEALMDYQVMVGKALPVHYNIMHDAPKYGYGVLWEYWERELKQTSRIVEQPVTFLGLPVEGRSRRVKVTERTVGYEGNKVMNVHPAHFWPDWRVPLTEFQRGEFVCRRVEYSWNQLVKGKAQGQYFNLDAVKEMAEANRTDDYYQGGRSVELPQEEAELIADPTAVDVQEGFEIVIEIIPRDWRLGKSEYPEKWAFSVVNDKVIIEAHPHGSIHNEFPAMLLPMDIDAYKLYTRSMLDRLRPLTDSMTWLLNQHMYNVRATLNNNFIYDPTRVVEKDLKRRGHSKLIRLKETAYGTDISKVIQQVPVADITGDHIGKIQALGEFTDRIYGVNDNLMGQIHPGGRKTATEIRTSSTFGVNRLKTVAEYWSAMAYVPHSQRLLQNTQQYYSAEKQFKVAGNLAADVNFIQVSPDMIAGAYDFVPVDGTMPIDRFAQANLWREILFGMSKIPELSQRYDMGGIFSFMAQLSGLKNIKQFEVQLAPEEQIQQQAQAGNLVPIRGAERDLARVPEPGQVAGLGTT